MTSTLSQAAQIRALAAARLVARTRTDFPFFLFRTLKTIAPAAHYQPNWHIEAMAAYLDAAATGEITRLVINLPPRMLKSTLVSVAWPAWLLAQQPDIRIMAASYAQSLAVKHSTDCRAVLQSRWYRQCFPATRLSGEQNEKEKFATTRRGYRLATSVGGAATGEGGRILIVDDPINPLQAGQHTARQAVNQWFDHTFATRLDDKRCGSIVVVMQRLHTEDLSGYLLARGGWEHLNLPAIAPSRTVVQLGGFEHVREAGEALHPARENLALLERTKRELGRANFSAQYQQQPISAEGTLVKAHWFARSVPAQPWEGCVQSWDTAIKAGDGHDASACATFVERDGVHYLVDMLVAKLEYPALKRAMQAHAQRFRPEAILVEDKASGQSLLQDLRGEATMKLIARQPVGDKLTRLIRVTPLMEAGCVALPPDAPWLMALEQELYSFPHGAHDDQVDAISQYLNWVRERAARAVPGLRRL